MAAVPITTAIAAMVAATLIPKRRPDSPAAAPAREHEPGRTTEGTERAGG
jgi:hypothetical protein